MKTQKIWIRIKRLAQVITIIKAINFLFELAKKFAFSAG
jgi:hypothetical protein